MADLTKAFELTIQHEGGFQKDPDDSGNWTGGEIGVGELKGTKWGISAAQYPHLDIESLTPAQAAELYRDSYWKQGYSQIDSQAVANKLFDMGILFGVGTAVKILQITLTPSFNDIAADGVFGNHTLNAVNQSEEHSLLQAYKTSLVSHILKIAALHPEKKKYVAGWGARINS